MHRLLVLAARCRRARVVMHDRLASLVQRRQSRMQTRRWAGPLSLVSKLMSLSLSVSLLLLWLHPVVSIEVIERIPRSRATILLVGLLATVGAVGSIASSRRTDGRPREMVVVAVAAVVRSTAEILVSSL